MSGRAAVMLTTLGSFVLAAALFADAPPGSDQGSESPLSFRRLMIPKDLNTTWFPNYRPIRRETFEAEIERINERARRDSQTKARITRATYRARLVGNELLMGEAILDVSRSVEEPTMLSMSPCGLAIGALRWEADPTSSIQSGTIAGGELIALVNRDGPLQFSWSARGTRSENGVHSVDLSLPRCAATRLLIDLPADLSPQIDGGVIITRPEIPTTATSPLPADMVSSSLYTWEIELGGHHQVTLRLVPQPKAPPDGTGVLLRENVRYRITASGLELRATFQLAASNAHIDQLVLLTTPGLHIAAAQVGERFLTLARPSAADGDDSVQVVLDEPLVGADHEMVVLAYAPLVIDQPWNLPRVRPQGAMWQEGKSIIDVIEPLDLAGLEVRNGTETKIEPLPAPEHGESRQLQFWEADGTAQVRLVYPPRQIEADIGTSIRFTELAATARMVLDVQARQGTSFSLRGLVSPGWTIDSVQSEPAEVLESFTTRAGPRQELLIQLRRAIPADQRWRLVVRAHRRTPRLDQPLRADTVRLIEFPQLNINNRLMALSTEPPLRMTLAGDENLQRRDPSKLSGPLTELVTPSPESIMFLDRRTGKDWTLTLGRDLPRFSAQVNHTVEVDSKQSTESFELRCEPNQSFLSRFLVHLSRSDSIPLEWELVDAGDNLLSARLVSASPDVVGGESWELSLSRPLNRPFVVRAIRQQTMEKEIQLSFVSLPESASQTGTLRVFALGSGPLEIRVRNLQPIATNLPETQKLPTLRGAYRYAPSQEVAATIARLPATDAPAAAWLWLNQTDSRYDANGEMLHESRLHLENTGLAAMDVTLPAESVLLRVAVDHGVLSHPALNGRQLVVPLPKDRRFPLVSVVYRTRSNPLELAAKIPATDLVCQLPCLRRRSQLWVPTGFAAFDESEGSEILSWDERLFGIRIWSQNLHPFDPFARSDWNDLRLWLRQFSSDSMTPDPAATNISPPGSSWVGIAPAIGVEEAACGWSAHEFPVARGQQRELIVYRRDLATAATAGLLLAAVGLAATVSRLRWRPMLLCTVVLAAAVLIVPADFVSVPRAMFFGTALGLMWARLPRRRLIAPPVSESSIRKQSGNSQSFVIASTTPGLLLFALLSSPAWLAAQDKPPANEPEKAPTYNVLSPVDDKQQPLGDYLFVPQILYDAIYRRANERFGSQFGAWLESADYHVTFTANDEGDSRLLAREFAAEYSLRSQEPVTSITIPWRQDRFRILEATLDGQSLPQQWDATGTALIVPLETQGAHRFKVISRPLQVGAETAGELLAMVPACPRSRVVVHAPGLVERIEVPGAMGVVSQDEAAGTVVAELGSVEELRVRWVAPVPKNQKVVDSDVAELLWLHVQANSITVNGKFRFSARNGTIGQVAFKVDRRLTLLPISKGQPVSSVEVRQGETQLIRCWLDRPYEEVTLQLSFSMTGSGGVGRWLLPRISAQATRHGSVWYGITVTEGMLAEIMPGSVATKVAPSAFLAAWQEDREAPQQAFTATSESQQWQLAVRPMPPRITMQEQQDVLVGNDRASFRYEAVVLTEQGRITHLNFYVPNKFEIRDVIALHDDANRLLRWSRVSDREISVFFTVPLSGEVRLLMQGDVVLTRGNSVRLPIIAATNTSTGQRRIELFQDDDVQVELLESSGLLRESRSAGRLTKGRFIAALTDSSKTISQPTLELGLQPNQPQVTGSLVTSMSLWDEQWRAETSLHVDVLSGTIHAIRLQIPEEMTGQIQIDPPVEHQSYPAPGGRGQLLVARLPTAVDRELKLTIAADLSIPPGEPIRVPEIRVLDVASLQRYVVLPTRLQRQKALWDISGLQSAELPEEHVRPPGENDVAVYRAVGPRVQAVLREVERLTGTPQVHLADYQVQWTTDQHVRGVGSYYLEPSRLSEVELAMPPGTKPLYFKVAGLPAAGRRVSPNHWRVSLGPELLPQLVEVLFEGELAHRPSDGGDITFAAPAITGIPVAQTLWTIQAPAGFIDGQPLLEHTTADAARLDSIRKGVMESLRRRGLEDASRANPSERDAWRADWDSRIRYLAERSEQKKPAVVRNAADAMNIPSDLGGQWFFESNDWGPRVRSTLHGTASQITVRYPRWSRHRWISRIGGFASLCMIALGGFWLVRRAWWHELWCRCPQLFLAIGGVLWWLFCAPSVVGLAVLLLSAISSLRTRWRTLPL